MLAVVGDLRRASAGAWLDEVDAQPLAASLDGGGINTAGLQRAEAALGEIVLRKTADKSGRASQLGQLNGGIRLGAAEAKVEEGGIGEAMEIGHRKAEHDFSEANDVSHWKT